MSSTIFKRKSNVKQILVELSKLYPWLCLSLFEFWAYFVVFLFSVQLKKITFLVWESQSVLSFFQPSFQARVGKAFPLVELRTKILQSMLRNQIKKNIAKNEAYSALLLSSTRICLTLDFLLKIVEDTNFYKFLNFQLLKY